MGVPSPLPKVRYHQLEANFFVFFLFRIRGREAITRRTVMNRREDLGTNIEIGKGEGEGEKS